MTVGRVVSNRSSVRQTGRTLIHLFEGCEDLLNGQDIVVAPICRIRFNKDQCHIRSASSRAISPDVRSGTVNLAPLIRTSASSASARPRSSHSKRVRISALCLGTAGSHSRGVTRCHKSQLSRSSTQQTPLPLDALSAVTTRPHLKTFPTVTRGVSKTPDGLHRYFSPNAYHARCLRCRTLLNQVLEVFACGNVDGASSGDVKLNLQARGENSCG